MLEVQFSALSCRVWHAGVCQYNARGQWQKFLLRLDKVSVRYNLQYFSPPPRTQVKVFAWPKSMALMIMTLAEQKVAQSLEYANATLLGFLKMPNIRSLQHPPPHPTHGHTHTQTRKHTHTHKRYATSCAKSFLRVGLAI